MRKRFRYNSATAVGDRFFISWQAKTCGDAFPFSPGFLAFGTMQTSVVTSMRVPLRPFSRGRASQQYLAQPRRPPTKNCAVPVQAFLVLPVLPRRIIGITNGIFCC